jgi:hypothetical protein
MRRLLASTAILAALSTPCFAQTAAAPVAGIWSQTAPSPGVCRMAGASNGYTLTIGASLSQPNVFTLDITGPFAPGTTPVAMLMFGGGLSQNLAGQFVTPSDLQIELGNYPSNNFATFLHGFTSGITMSAIVGSTAMDFNLAGTSAVVGALGQCTTVANFNGLPAPWRPAVDFVAPPPPAAVYTPPAPVYQPPAPQPVTWIPYNYGNQVCEYAPLSPKALYNLAAYQLGYDVTISRDNGPDGNLEHVRLTYPDPDKPGMVKNFDFFTNDSACEEFRSAFVNANSDLN